MLSRKIKRQKDQKKNKSLFVLILFSLLSCKDPSFNFHMREPLSWPLKHGVITSHPGRRWGGLHTGIDISVRSGTPTSSAGLGDVIFVGYHPAYGNRVEVYHNQWGIISSYSHLKKILVSYEQRVEKDTIIGEVGNTGTSTGPHLHFEIYSGRVYLNPIKILGDHNFKERK